MKITFAKLILICGTAAGTLLVAQMPDQPAPVHKAANLDFSQERKLTNSRGE
jgi:hypothetical protein